MTKLTLTAVGTSTGVVIPAEMLARLNVKSGDVLYAVETGDGNYLLTPNDPALGEKLEKAYATALEDPDSLGAFLTDDDLEDGCDNEDLNYAAERAFEAKGRDRNELARNSNEFESPQGPVLALDSLPTVLPKLTKRFPNWLR